VEVEVELCQKHRGVSLCSKEGCLEEATMEVGLRYLCDDDARGTMLSWASDDDSASALLLKKLAVG